MWAFTFQFIDLLVQFPQPFVAGIVPLLLIVFVTTILKRGK